MASTRIIAHRGASGHLPEHTLAAKALAYGFGADFIEQDVIASRDGHPIVLHDLHLNDVSDVARRFPARARRDGLHYAADFDLDELRELRLCERRAPGQTTRRFPGRFEASLDGFRVVSLDEELAFVASLNRTTARNVGVYPEIKDPDWHESQGLDVTRLTVECLGRFGYDSADADAFLQSFSLEALIRARDELGCRTPRVLLLDAAGVAALDAETGGWARVARNAAGVGLPYERLLEPDAGGRPVPAALSGRLRDAGLEMHPYTLRSDELGPGGFRFDDVLDCLIHSIGVEALFCDQPDAALAARARA